MPFCCYEICLEGSMVYLFIFALLYFGKYVSVGQKVLNSKILETGPKTMVRLVSADHRILIPDGCNPVFSQGPVDIYNIIHGSYKIINLDNYPSIDVLNIECYLWLP